MSHIADNWNSNIVFATVTQPAFNHLDDSIKQQCPAGWQPREIVSGHANMMDSTRRVEFTWLDDWFIAASLADYDENLGYQKPESLNCWIA